MSFPVSYLFFFATLTSGSFLSISSSSWFGAWLGLELNLLSFLPLVCVKASSHLSESAIKYFLIQAMASTIFIMASALNMMSPDWSYFLILLSLVFKVGGAPFHFWFPQVAEGLLWPQVVILFTIQKMAPMVLMTYLMANPFLSSTVVAMGVASALAGALGGLNASKLRKIMAFSSINHMSWMFLAISLNDLLWVSYFLVYCMVSSSVIFLFHSSQSYAITDLSNKLQAGYMSPILAAMGLLSMGGLPPFTGFVPKWLMIQLLLNSGSGLPLCVLLFSSLITLYFYLRMVLPMVVTSFISLKMTLNKLSFHYLSPFLVSCLCFVNLFGILLPLPLL